MTTATNKPAPAGSALENPTILIVDDESIVLDVQKRIVERAGYPCLTASSGTEAVEQLREHPEVELVVLDAILPDTSGASLFHKLKALRPAIKIIGCSGMRDEGPAQAIVEAGADDFLAKPFTASQLLERLCVLLAR